MKPDLLHALNQLPLAFFATDADGVITCAEGAVFAPGGGGERLIGRSMLAVMADSPDLNEARRALAGEARHFETEVQGTWYEVWLTPLRDDEGRPAGMAGVSVEMTARRRAQVDLRESEERARLVFTAAPVTLMFTDVSGRVIDINPAAERTTGYTLAEFKQLSVWVLYERRSDREAMLADLLAGRKVQDVPLKLRRKNGEVFDGLMTALLVPFRGDNTIIASVRDVTELARTVAALQRSESLYRTLVENVPERIVLKDRNLRYVSANSAHARHLGVPLQALEGQADEDFLPAEVAARYRDAERRVLQTGETSEFSEEFVEGGRRRFVRGVRVPVRGGGGDVNGVLSTFTDVTEARTLEEQLRQAQKLEAIGTLAGGVAHDFNNHMTIVNGYCDLILEQLAHDDPLREQVSEIRAAGSRAADLTQQLLAFSRKQVSEPRVLDLNACIRDLQKMLRRLIGDHVVLSTHLQEGLGGVRADPGQVQQVLMNLVVNARDAMPAGGEVTIRTSNVSVKDGETSDGVPAGSYVLLSVADTGNGIDAAAMEHIFEPFFTTKERGRGTGLGLSTVYGIVRQNGGYLTVDSRPGEGANFRIFLPMVDARPEEVSAARPSAHDLRGTETILLVEDQPELRKLTATVLRKYGYVVLEAADGEGALRSSEHYPRPIHLLLTDMVMPGMSGLELGDRLLAARPSTRLLFVSGYPDPFLDQEQLRARGLAFLAKPFSPETLAAKVREVLGEARGLPSVLIVSPERTLRSLLRRLLKGTGYEIFDVANGKAASEFVRNCQVDLIVADLDMKGQNLELLAAVKRSHPEMEVLGIGTPSPSPSSSPGHDSGLTHTVLRKPIRPDGLLRAVQRLTGRE